MKRSSGRAVSQPINMSELYAFKWRVIWWAFKHESPAFIMLCIYFFFEYVRPQNLYPVLDVLPWAQICLIATLFFSVTDRTVVSAPNILNKLFILLGIIIILSGVFAFRPSDSVAYWEVMGGWIIVYFLVITIVNTEQRLFLFLLVYCLFNFKMSQHGAISWAQRGFSFASFGLIGAPGWFRNSGEYAIQMLIFGPIAVAIVMALKDYWGRYKKWILYVCAATGYMAVIGASSRGAQIALAVTAVLFLLKQKNGLKNIFVICVIAAALYYLLPDEQIQRFGEMGNDASSLQRLEYWKFAINNVIPNYPALGVGYNNWLSYVWFKQPGGMGPAQIVENVHNIYLQAAAELGITGLVIFLVMVLFAFVTNIRTRKLTRELDNQLFYNLSYAFDAGLIGFLVAGSFVTVLYYPFFWMQIAMIVMLNNVAQRSQKSERSERFPTHPVQRVREAG